MQETEKYKNKGVLNNNTEIRNTILQKNMGKYNMYEQELLPFIGEVCNVYSKENRSEGNKLDILNYTYNPESKFADRLNLSYGRNIDNLSYYVVPDIKPSCKVNDYEGFDDYISYMWDTYGKEETFLGYITELLKVRDNAEKLGFSITDDTLNKNFTDYINQIKQYGDIKYAMEQDSVGIVRNLDVAKALFGVVTTNINNFGGKETKMGMITNYMYANTLLRAAQFNTLRRTQYITPDLDKLYGNNMHNIYSLSTMFRIDPETGRFPEMDNEYYLPYESYTVNTNSYTLPLENTRTILYSYSEGNGSDNSENINESYVSFEEVDKTSFIDDVQTIDSIDGLNEESLLKKTNDFLKKRKINTILSRFHDENNREKSLYQSAVSDWYGVSHGRNLLTKKAYKNREHNNINAYSNPYCRVWTSHHQYSKMKHLIRPFIDDGNFMSIADIQQSYSEFRPNNGAKYLSDNTVLNRNGMVNILPFTDAKGGVDVTKCMFSIENLAWKDVLVEYGGQYRKNSNNELVSADGTTLSKEQQGPNGGRIMWFPPYDLTFQETASATWNKSEFIGRGEPIYTYANATRNGTLSFKLLVDHPSVIDYWGLNHKNPTEDDEQEALRFFAGCETLEIADNNIVVNKVDNEIINASKNVQEIEGETKFSFYVFFPNNYSGVDDNSSLAMEKLFRGDAEGKIDETYYYGYEMGTNPLSVQYNMGNKFLFQEFIITSDVSSEKRTESKSGNTAELNICEQNNCEWQYPVDDFKKDEKLVYGKNYSDNRSFGLNSTFDIVQSVMKDDTIRCSFGEFYAVASGNNDYKTILKACERAVLARKYGDDENVIDEKMQEIDDRLKRIEKILFPKHVLEDGTEVESMRDDIITNVKVSATATKDGESSGNVQLKDNRRETVKKFLETLSVFKNKEIENDSVENDSSQNISDDNDISSLIAKQGKYAKVTITLSNKESVKNRKENSVKTVSENMVVEQKVRRIQPRYDDEYRFFSLLKENDNVAYNRLVDKIKYFSPAYHSMTPEGFNARLTFLQQCTRQGPTCSASDMSKSNTAANLAFGRAPFCVLRIGDFLNTKIVINSVGITYPDSMWDLNPEGIGVQFMYAEVSLNIDIIGGSDLGAPIKRLQNAVSFNYYANTSVYDNRSDKAVYVNNNIVNQQEWFPETNNIKNMHS